MCEIKVEVTYYTVGIYINDLLHVRFNRKNYIGLQSWIDGDSQKKYSIEFHFTGHSFYTDYDNKEIWSEILKELDEKL